MQRNVHKPHLFFEDRLVKGSYPDKEFRKRLALQIGERRRESDAFSLLTMISDPLVNQYMLKIADYVASGTVGYYVGDVIDRLRREPDSNKQIFIGSIYRVYSTVTGPIL